MEDFRFKGIAPGKRRLEMGLPAVIRPEDGAVVEISPDGGEKILAEATESSASRRTSETSRREPSASR